MTRDLSASLGSPTVDLGDEIFQRHPSIDLPPNLRVVPLSDLLFQGAPIWKRNLDLTDRLEGSLPLFDERQVKVPNGFADQARDRDPALSRNGLQSFVLLGLQHNLHFFGCH